MEFNFIIIRTCKYCFRIFLLLFLLRPTQENALPDSLQEYLRLLQSRTEGAEEEVKECEIILEKLPSGVL